MQALDKFIRSSHCAAGGEHIIMQHDNIVGCDGVAVNLDDIRAILFGILLTDGISRQFAGLTCGDKTGTDS